MSPVIDTILAHRSIRRYTAEPIAKEQLEAIIEAGLAASSSSLLQSVSIIRITDRQKRQALARLAGEQAYVASAAEFLVFCIDFQRHFTLDSTVRAEFMELVLIGAIDAGIMAQNCLLAAESLGLGGVYIGGLRNCPTEVDQLLDMPPRTAVLFGMCLGHPAEDPEKKPRLPARVIVHENRYSELDMAEITRYDQTMHEYYARRSSNQKAVTWSTRVIDKLAGESRPHMLSYLHDKGLATR
ncbi:MAG: oxygen-insensitive NADPH nitroreductase [Desulfopila sp.]